MDPAEAEEIQCQKERDWKARKEDALITFDAQRVLNNGGKCRCEYGEVFLLAIIHDKVIGYTIFTYSDGVDVGAHDWTLDGTFSKYGPTGMDLAEL